MLLKVCGPNGTNPRDDIDGPFFTETYGRTDSGFPANHVLGSPGSTGFHLVLNNFGQAAACLWCAHGLQADTVAHLRKCEEWLRDEKHQQMKKDAPELSDAELRAVARITLDQKPDLSHGLESIAGYFTKKGGKKKLSVQYNFKDLEELAFPMLILEASGFKGKTMSEIQHYTLMRLYSADKQWRECSDYVVFSVHRMAAYGLSNAKAIVEQLPAPLPRERTNEIESIKISFRRPSYD
jgi:hypothetical protein